MLDKKIVSTVVSDRALEMVMLDVMDCLSEISLESGYKPTEGGFEIIEIYSAKRETAPNAKSHHKSSTNTGESDILQFPNLRRAAG